MLEELNVNENSTMIEENEFYCPEYIEHLLKRYMPYCFIWSGFVIKNLNNENTRTRFTNGTVENHFYSNKGMCQFFKRLLPAQYVNKSYKLNIGKCREFMSETIDNEIINSDDEESADKENRLTCWERWAKKLNLPATIKNTYQASANLDLATKRVSKDILLRRKKGNLNLLKQKVQKKVIN